MVLVERQIVKEKDYRYKELDKLCLLSKNLYNATLYSIRQYFFKTGKYLNYNEVNKEFTHSNNVDYRALPAKVSKMTQMLVDKAFKSFFMKRKNGDIKVKIPKYLHKDGRQVVSYTKQALSFKEVGYIQLSKTDIKIKTNRSKDSIQFIRLTPFKKHIVIEVGYNEDVKMLDSKGRYASIDLGVNNLAAVTSNVMNPFIINGRPLKSINQYYNKELAKERSKLSKVGLRCSKRVDRLHFKRNNKVNDYMHKASRYIVNQLVSQDIDTLVVGYNKKWKQDIKLSKVNNQKFVGIPFLKFVGMLEYKCELVGIKLVIQEESYTSKCSFIDNEDIKKHKDYKGRRLKRGLYRTLKGVIVNADINGSYNILKKYLKGQEVWEDRILSDCIEVCSTPIIISL